MATNSALVALLRNRLVALAIPPSRALWTALCGLTQARLLAQAVTNPDDLEGCAEALCRQEMTHDLAQADADAHRRLPEGPAETAAGFVRALSSLLRAAEQQGREKSALVRDLALPTLEAFCTKARANLRGWQEAAGCSGWTLVADWTAEIDACATADVALTRIEARVEDLAYRLDSPVYRRMRDRKAAA